jgi:hypothetical protein
VRVIRRRLLVHPTQIEQTVDLPHQVIGRNYFVELKRIEKLSLSFLPPPHHAPLPLMPSSPTESWFAIRIKGSFATQLRASRTRFAHAEFFALTPKQTAAIAERTKLDGLHPTRPSRSEGVGKLPILRVSSMHLQSRPAKLDANDALEPARHPD